MEIEVHSVAVVNAGFGAFLSQFQVHGWPAVRQADSYGNYM